MLAECFCDLQENQGMQWCSFLLTKYSSHCFFLLKILNSFTNLFTFHESPFYIWPSKKWLHDLCLMYTADCDVARPTWLKSGAKIVKMPSNVEIKAKVEDFVQLVRKAKELSASEGYPCSMIAFISECHSFSRSEEVWEPPVYRGSPKLASHGHRWAE